MKYKSDTIIELLDHTDELSNLVAMQEELLLKLHNASVERRAAKTPEAKADADEMLLASATVDAERAATLNSALSRSLTELHSQVRYSGEDSDDLYDTIRAVRDMLFEGTKTHPDGDDLSFIDAAIDMLGGTLPEIQEVAHDGE